jgi:hypothetical protein
MKRSTKIATGVTTGVALIGAGALAIAAPWQPDTEPVAQSEVAAQTTTTTQARWGQGQGGGGAGQGQAQGQGQGHGQGQGSGQQTQSHEHEMVLPESTGDITAETAQMLAYMAEEEKLAHDLYVALGETYDARQFDNVARAETQHLDAVRALLERYDVDDPTTGAAAGEFTDPDLQGLYDDLLASGLTSLAAAADAGITVEQTDIADLTEALETTDAPDVEQVLTDLLEGSQRHLAAFERLAARA